jgi:hypothetical protein
MSGRSAAPVLAEVLAQVQVPISGKA